MVILLTGATGFIGRHLQDALMAAGHIIVPVQRRPTSAGRAIQGDFTRDLDKHDWLPRLAGIDAVINAVGIIRESGAQTFERIHTQAPRALFAACAEAGVRRVLQISALGADTGTTRYFVTKRAADEFLVALPLEWTILQPSLVYGPDGTSARLFTMLASLPLTPLPGRGEQCVQPVYIDDLTAAVVAIFSRNDTVRCKIPIVGPQPLMLREFLQRLRISMRLGTGRFVRIPSSLVRFGARIAELVPGSLLDRENLAMLEAGNTSDPAPMQRLLNRLPRPVAAFIPRHDAEMTASSARLRWLLPLLRHSIAIVWIWTGIVSLGLYPRAESYELLARTGITGAAAPVMLYGAALLDLALGLGTLFLRRRRWLWLTQMALILFYTIVISLKLPEFWLHPYGPLLKNLPMLVGIYVVYGLEERSEW